MNLKDCNDSFSGIELQDLLENATYNLNEFDQKSLASQGTSSSLVPPKFDSPNLRSQCAGSPSVSTPGNSLLQGVCYEDFESDTNDADRIDVDILLHGLDEDNFQD